MNTLVHNAGARAPAQSLARLTAQQIIDGYRSGRFTPRDVMWIAAGHGEWHAPLTPATIATMRQTTAQYSICLSSELCGPKR